jgi:hypothetical protein
MSFRFSKMRRLMTMQPKRWAQRLTGPAIAFMTIGQPDLVRQIIAKRIIEVARKGERNPDELCARPVASIGLS